MQIDGVAYACPMYVVRAGSAWQVRVPGTRSVYFADSLFGSIAQSHHAALRYRESAAPVTELRRPLAERERAGKLAPTGIPGVFLQVKHRSGKKREHHLRVQLGDRAIRTVYVGTDSTWEKNFDQKMETARPIRANTVSEKLRPVSLATI